MSADELVLQCPLEAEPVFKRLVRRAYTSVNRAAANRRPKEQSRHRGLVIDCCANAGSARRGVKQGLPVRCLSPAPSLGFGATILCRQPYAVLANEPFAALRFSADAGRSQPWPWRNVPLLHHVAKEAAIGSFLSATRLASFWERLRVSFWFLPSMMAAAAFALSFVLVQLDRLLGAETVRKLGWLYTFGPEGARAVLSTIAGSMITVAGLTFSITMLTLQLAASQFGPRMLRDFMRDRGNQIVLGTFIATFLYCLLVLRTVRGTEDASFTPHIAVAFGVLLAVASLAVLIFFLHHIATSIRIETLLAELARQATEAVDRLYPAQVGEGPAEALGEDEETADNGGPECVLVSAESGYVQRIDHESLMRLACEQDRVISIESRPGAFVAVGTPILKIRGPSPVTEDDGDRLRDTVIIGIDRTPHQDLELSLRRIVEIAQRALSPGINDPTTALYCIDRLGETLARLATRPIPASQRFDKSGQLRVIADSANFTDLALPAFAAVARYGLADADVIRQLLAAMDRVGCEADPAEASRLRKLRAEIANASLAAMRLPWDKALV